jgi:hypothetical protein
MNYMPKNTNYLAILDKAEVIRKNLKAIRMIDLRIARGGCFVARYYIKTVKIKGIEVDRMYEVKIYDNLKS